MTSKSPGRIESQIAAYSASAACFRPAASSWPGQCCLRHDTVGVQPQIGLYIAEGLDRLGKRHAAAFNEGGQISGDYVDPIRRQICLRCSGVISLNGGHRPQRHLDISKILCDPRQAHANLKRKAIPAPLGQAVHQEVLNPMQHIVGSGLQSQISQFEPGLRSGAIAPPGSPGKEIEGHLVLIFGQGQAATHDHHARGGLQVGFCPDLGQQRPRQINLTCSNSRLEDARQQDGFDRPALIDAGTRRSPDLLGCHRLTCVQFRGDQPHGRSHAGGSISVRSAGTSRAERISIIAR